MGLKPSDYQAVKLELDRRQASNHRILMKRFEKIYEAFPRIKEIDHLLASGSIAKTKSLLEHDKNTTFSSLKEGNELLSKEKQAILTEHGYPTDYLEPLYTCPLCKDTGYVGNEKCICFKQAIVDYLYNQSNIKDILKTENFSTFSLDYYEKDPLQPGQPSPYENMTLVLEKCKQFIENFDQHQDNILFMGNAGVGKTFLSNCIAKELLDRFHTVTYFTAFGLFDLMEKNRFGKEEEKQLAKDTFEYILDCDLLIIDDLGTEFNNSFVSSQLFVCMNERSLRRKSTIISTNLTLGDIAHSYSERISSRFMEYYHIFSIYGGDIRLKKALK